MENINNIAVNINELILSKDFGQSLFFKSDVSIISTDDHKCNYRIEFFNGQINKLVYESSYTYDYIWTSLKECGWKYNTIIRGLDNISVYYKDNVTCTLRKLENKNVLVCFFKKIID